jgi:hypothetical protein
VTATSLSALRNPPRSRAHLQLDLLAGSGDNQRQLELHHDGTTEAKKFLC